MTRRAFRAWKCRQNIHRIDLFGNGNWPTCKDCRVEIDLVVAADVTAGPDMLVIAMERFGRAHVFPEPPKTGDALGFSAGSGRDASAHCWSHACGHRTRK